MLYSFYRFSRCQDRALERDRPQQRKKNKIHSKLSGPAISLDLTLQTSSEYVMSLTKTPRCIYVHFAPPCGTASRARFIKRKFRYNPPALRTDAYPDGLPNLNDEWKARAQAASHLYDLTQQLCRACHQHGVLFSIENLARSFMSDTKAMKLS